MKYLSCCLLWKLNMNHGIEEYFHWQKVFRTLLSGWNNIPVKYRLEDMQLASSPAERVQGVLVGSSSVSVRRVCPASPEGNSYPGVHQTHHQPTKRGDCPAESMWSHLEYLGRMWRSLNVSKRGQPSWWKGWKECLLMSGWDLCACLFWRN